MSRKLLGLLLVLLAVSQAGADSSWTGGGGGTISHATDCPNSGVVAAPGTVCVDQDDGKLWTCKASPTAGANSTMCDIAADWLLGSSSSASGVTTFNSRAGVVVPAAADYNATQVTSTATGTVAATTVQAAIAELETEKQGAAATLTTLGGKSVSGSDNAIPTIASGATAGLCVQTKSGGGIETAAAACGTGGGVADGSVTNAKLADMANATLKCRTTAGTGVPEDCNAAQSTNLLNAFTSSLKGLVPASGGGTTTFLRADGNWGTPSGSILNFESTAPPTANDDIDLGFVKFSRWIDTSSSPAKVWVCVDNTADAAVWKRDDDTNTDAQGLASVLSNGRKDTTLVSEAASLDLGDGTGGKKMWRDGANGWIEKVYPDQHQSFEIPTGFAAIFRYNGTEGMRFDSQSLKFANSWRPLKSVTVQGREFGGCTYAEAVIGTNKPKVGAFTCTDNDNDGFDFDTELPLNWNAGTVTVRLNMTSVNASPSGNVKFSCSGQAVSDGEVISNRGVSNEQSATITLATQYFEENATTPAITLNGSTLAAGDHIYMHCDIDAAGTTTTQMADVRINAVAHVYYTVTSISESAP